MISLLIGLASCAPWAPAETTVDYLPLPAALQDVTVEHGERHGQVALCESPGTFVPFDRPIERQVFDVLTSYKTGMTDTLERLTAKTIVAESERYGLDPWFVIGVIRVESRFNNFAESNKGARGLMQLLPSTGEELATDLGIQWQGPESLFNPVKNVKMGVAYLAILDRRFGGDHDKTLAAYNMGPNRVREWLAVGRELPTGYASLCQDYQKLLRRVAKQHEGGRDLRGPITAIERSVAKRNAIVISPAVANANDSVLPEANEPAIEPLDDSTPQIAIDDTQADGGLADALLNESKLADVEPAFDVTK